MTRSAVFEQARDRWHEIRDEFELYREAAFTAASDELAGALLNDRGRRAGIDAYSLFIGPEVRALAYASEELVEWWAAHPRLTFTRFERQRVEESW